MTRSLLLLFAAVTLLAAATPALAQTPQRLGARTNDRLVSEALEGLGVDPGAPAFYRAVDRAFAELYPRERYDRYRLSRTQARAVAYIALLMAAEGTGYGTPDRPGYPDRPGGGTCGNALDAAYDLAARVPREGGLFLTDAEKADVRRGADDIRRLATSCGCIALADRALELGGLLGDSLVRRATIVTALDGVRTAAADCR